MIHQVHEHEIAVSKIYVRSFDSITIISIRACNIACCNTALADELDYNLFWWCKYTININCSPVG